MLDRRHILWGGMAAAAGCFTPSAMAASAVPARDPRTFGPPFSPAAGKRSRVIFVNDLSGDIDGLFATVHAILSPSIDLRAIVGTATDRKEETAQRSAVLGREILDLMGLAGKYPVIAGASGRIRTPGVPVRSTASDVIIAEAMRTDTKLPLFVAVGGGLTEVASAVMIEPRIAERMTLVWIGGDPYPAGGKGETNFNIDPLAAQFLFNETPIRIWQVTRGVYATCVVSAAELQARVAPQGKIGQWLYRKVVDMPARFHNFLNPGETWTLGDNPLVVLTALNDWPPSGVGPMRYEHTGSSLFDDVVAPRLNDDGTFSVRQEGRKIRIYRTVDTRLMFEDFFAKLRINFPGE